ncbi:hypothetical protein STTU_3395 [Streptomyces sp. Tu6071]|nr:hypothetical protein STTU_3395 [Streptomyces sp. Tu6071]
MRDGDARSLGELVLVHVRGPADPTIVSHLKGDGVRRHFREGERVTLSYDPKNHRDMKLAEDRKRGDPWWGVLYVSPFGLIPLALAWIGLSILQ